MFYVQKKNSDIHESEKILNQNDICFSKNNLNLNFQSQPKEELQCIKECHNNLNVNKNNQNSSTQNFLHAKFEYEKTKNQNQDELSKAFYNNKDQGNIKNNIISNENNSPQECFKISKTDKELNSQREKEITQNCIDECAIPNKVFDDFESLHSHFMKMLKEKLFLLERPN